MKPLLAPVAGRAAAVSSLLAVVGVAVLVALVAALATSVPTVTADLPPSSQAAAAEARQQLLPSPDVQWITLTRTETDLLHNTVAVIRADPSTEHLDREADAQVWRFAGDWQQRGSNPGELRRTSEYLTRLSRCGEGRRRTLVNDPSPLSQCVGLGFDSPRRLHLRVSQLRNVGWRLPSSSFADPWSKNPAAARCA